ncbi:MAG: hypothetical protein WC954_05985 [Sphaerochaeta sp.]
MAVGGIGWIILSFVVARGAKNRGRSYGGYLLFSLFFSPIIAGFALLLLDSKQ